MGKVIKKILGISGILVPVFGLCGTLLITFATQISQYVKHGLPSGGMAHAVVILHPNWIRCGVVFIIVAFTLNIAKVISVKQKNKKRY